MKRHTRFARLLAGNVLAPFRGMPFPINDEWRARAQSPGQVLSHVKSGHRVFVQGASATPTLLLDTLMQRRDLEHVQLYHLHLAGKTEIADATHGNGVFSSSLFAGPAQRGPIERGEAEFIPVFLSDIPNLFISRQLALDVAIVQLSPPDKHGHCTLGTSVDVAKAAADSAPILLAEINERMPRTHGNTIIPLSRVTAFTCTNRPLPESSQEAPGPVSGRIGELVSELVEDGATLQLGVGAIPNAVLARLNNKLELGVHTETFSDGLIPLVEAGVVTNRAKQLHKGRTVTSFVSGSQRVFDFVDDNALVEFHPSDRTNHAALICQNPKVVAINSALEIDLTGQVCADSIGSHIFSGIGGQLDFMRGAALSAGGKPIIALPATAAHGSVSRIVPTLKPGAGVVTTRGHVHWIVTEYGRVNLHGLNLRERAEALISIAHPDFRSELRRDVQALRHFTL
jgi:acyl-CoA hydrolase